MRVDGEVCSVMASSIIKRNHVIIPSSSNQMESDKSWRRRNKNVDLDMIESDRTYRAGIETEHDKIDGKSQCDVCPSDHVSNTHTLRVYRQIRRRESKVVNTLVDRMQNEPCFQSILMRYTSMTAELNRTAPRSDRHSQNRLNLMPLPSTGRVNAVSSKSSGYSYNSPLFSRSQRQEIRQPARSGAIYQSSVNTPRFSRILVDIERPVLLSNRFSSSESRLSERTARVRSQQPLFKARSKSVLSLKRKEEARNKFRNACYHSSKENSVCDGGKINDGTKRFHAVGIYLRHYFIRKFIGDREVSQDEINTNENRRYFNSWFCYDR